MFLERRDSIGSATSHSSKHAACCVSADATLTGEFSMKVPACAAMLITLLMVVGCASQRLDTRSVEQLSGVELYERLCASCHGAQAKGDGPVASLIKIGVPDLTRIALRDGGEFPEQDVRRIIDGRFERKAHGPRDMPVWGWQLYSNASQNDASERARVDAMIGRMVDYLRSVQVTQ
jgi:hypothetical protein